MVASIKPPRYGLMADHLRGQRGRLPKKQLAAAHFGSKIRPDIKSLAANANLAKESACEGRPAKERL
jgi:hypothetical protein